MKIALIHDWLTGMRGGEKCLEVFCRLFPEADLYSLIHDRGKLSLPIERMNIKTSFLQRLPGANRFYRYFLPIMPFAIRQFDLGSYDLIISSSHCVAKNVKKPKNGIHICYCFTPMRYIWDQYKDYFNPKKSGALTRITMRFLRPLLQRWDVETSQEVTHFVAISHHVRKRIEKYYKRSADVIYPPIDTKFFSSTKENPDDYFLMVSALAPYKRVDLAVEAFNKLGYPLKIIGEGQDSRILKKMAAPNIKFLGWRSNEEIRLYYSRCRAFIFPGEEDFGITPLEAQAMGRPVIAYGCGGVLETVIPEELTWKPEYNIPRELTERPTGIFFHEQTADALIKAIRLFLSVENHFNPDVIRQNALAFDVDVFTKRIQNLMKDLASQC